MRPLCSPSAVSRSPTSVLVTACLVLLLYVPLSAFHNVSFLDLFEEITFPLGASSSSGAWSICAQDWPRRSIIDDEKAADSGLNRRQKVQFLGTFYNYFSFFSF
jgi:hypothetical protein